MADEDELLPNHHAGEILRSEFMEPLGLTTRKLAERIGVYEKRLQNVIDGNITMSLEMDAKLGRYFGMSDGFFMGLQEDYNQLRLARTPDAKGYVQEGH
jgi:addiction module HigA family antidote